jgi:hypothetical protein
MQAAVCIIKTLHGRWPAHLCASMDSQRDSIQTIREMRVGEGRAPRNYFRPEDLAIFWLHRGWKAVTLPGCFAISTGLGIGVCDV